MPNRIYRGAGSQTKTYMHQFVDSPDGSTYAFRYFPGARQPRGAKGPEAGGSPCDIWLCRSDLSGHRRAFGSPIGEGGHGSDVIVWVTDDLIYYAGLSYRVSTGEVLWRFEGSVAQVPLARNSPVSANKLYVAVRGHAEPDGHSVGEGTDAKGWFWIDPSSPTRPRLNPVCDMRELVPCYGGSWEHADATYIYQNPADSRLFAVVYDRLKRQEFAFILDAGDGSVVSYLGPNGVGRCHNGHVLWYDDSTLFAGNRHPGLFDLEGRLVERVAGEGQGNHVSVSPDRKWWVGDIHDEEVVRLYRFGSGESIVISADVRYDNHHPSFSRDGRYVFFQGKRPHEPHMGVYRVDVSDLAAAGGWEVI